MHNSLFYDKVCLWMLYVFLIMLKIKFDNV